MGVMNQTVEDGVGIGAGPVSEAETALQRGIEVACRQNALSWELRAATSLAQLWHQNGRTDEAVKLLSSVYSRFSEGFETADLMTARALTDTFRNSLSGDRGPLRRTRRLPPVSHRCRISTSFERPSRR
jgi:predicted ATPase